MLQEQDSHQHAGLWTVSGFDTGTSKTLAWDWAGEDAASGVNFIVSFFNGVTGVRSSGSEAVQDDGTPTTGLLSARTGDIVVGIASTYGTGSSSSWTNLDTNVTSWGTIMTNPAGRAKYGEYSPSGDVAVTNTCTSCSDYATVVAIVLK